MGWADRYLHKTQKLERVIMRDPFTCESVIINQWYEAKPSDMHERPTQAERILGTLGRHGAAKSQDLGKNSDECMLPK